MCVDNNVDLWYCWAEVINMPRTARIGSKTDIYHVIWRGVSRQNVFYEDRDFEKFLFIVRDAKSKFGFEVYAYCLMTNHIHILVKSRNLSNDMKWVAEKYAQWFNIKYERAGHLFQDRFLSEPIENDSYLMTVVRYIHQNPVKANICGGVGDYRWSSYNSYLNGDKTVDREIVLKIMGIGEFIKFNNKEAEDKCLEQSSIKVQITDEKAEEIAENFFRSKKISGFVNVNEEKRAELFKLLIEKHCSERQIVRLFNVSRCYIRRVLRTYSDKL